MTYRFILSIALVGFLCGVTAAQSTEITYQGQLQSASQTANGSFDFEFALFDSITGGSQIGSTQTRIGVNVSGGIFAVNLDFGNAFPGAQRFLEIRVRQAGGGTFTALSPRQSVSSSPYSVKSLSTETATNSSQLGGVPANQYVVTTDPRMSDARIPLPGSSNYIQNQNAAPQGLSNFNISGNGTAGGTLSGGTVNAATQFNLGSNRILTATNTFFGSTFLGFGAGNAGPANTFFGYQAGQANSAQANSNSFFGRFSGHSNTDGEDNSFFGSDAGEMNTTGIRNTFVGRSAGISTTTGSSNVFIGRSAGLQNTTGGGNTFVGANIGLGNSTGSNNTLLGNAANVSPNISFGTAIGAGSLVSQSNSVVLGRPSDSVHVPGNLEVAGNLTGNITVPAANITGVLPTANGGTGLASAGSSGNFLRSNGSAWTSSSLIAADIPSGSANYIQNQSAAVQPSSSFRISGNGTVGGTLSGLIINATTQFNFDGTRFISTAGSPSNTFVGFGTGTAITSGSQNSFFGENAGASTTTGENNSFFGIRAGQANTSGVANSFFGVNAGLANTTGNNNSFFGINAGQANTTGTLNSFFGRDAGNSNTTGGSNSFFGRDAGFSNTTGSQNAFFGINAGASNTAGNENTFIGRAAGVNNTTGSNNTAIGQGANVSAGNLNYATAIGSDAIVSNSNTVVLGRAADTVRVPGGFAVVGTMTTNANFAVLGASNLVGLVDLGTLGAAGSQALCRNVAGQISTCSSSMRYKTNLSGFSRGLNLINQLSPITFDWKDGGMHDLGLGAEDVAAIEPLLVTYNAKGEVEGVKYDRIGVVLVNAVKEQQRQIEKQDEIIKQHQAAIEALRAVVCSKRKNDRVCKGIR